MTIELEFKAQREPRTNLELSPRVTPRYIQIISQRGWYPMSVLPHRKHKIVLADYNYRRDVETRLLLSELSLFGMDVLKEILNNSLKIPIYHLAETLNVLENDLLSILDKLSSAKLLKFEKGAVVVDKEMRKYFDSQILKFEEDFEPGMGYLQHLLQKVPVHVLPSWYALPKTSDDFFQTILEKFLATPKIYERYLDEILFDDRLLGPIAKKLFAAPHYFLQARDVMKEFRLSHQQFQECMLLLEFSFVCCLSYRKVEGRYEEVIVPFYEWHQYLKFRKSSAPRSIADLQSIQRKHSQDFGFILDLTQLLKSLQDHPLELVPFEGGFSLKDLNGFSSAYCKNLIQKLLLYKLARTSEQSLYPTEISQEWLKKTLQDKALSLCKHHVQVERNLKRIIHAGWVYLEDFIRGFTGGLHQQEQVTLKNKGKRWKYVLPTYSEEDIRLIEKNLCENLFEAGIVAIGWHHGKTCLALTPFGKTAIED
jgi:hypothetical protein